jgi:hypothetical protein
VSDGPGFLPTDFRVVVRRGHDQGDGIQDRVRGQAEEQDRGQGHGRPSDHQGVQERDAQPKDAAGHRTREHGVNLFVQ